MESQQSKQIGSFRTNWTKDLLSGFLVSLIALPLCLGIAGASNFPPIMGVLTAIIGGMLVAPLAGSELTIKGPAAGLIVIVAGAVEELGRGNNELGWKLALGVVLVAGAIQVVLGLLKVAKLSDFFPLSAVHGMLAAIGIIIMSKQIHWALGVNPALTKGKEPLELLALVPHSLSHPTVPIAIIGLISLVILFGMPKINNPIVKKIPPALIVLIVGVVLGQVMGLNGAQYADVKPLVNPGDFALGFNVSFAGMTGDLLPIFLKYLLMFALIGSLESLLTGKAIDILDPKQNKSNLSKDLFAVGLGNMASGLLGGLPMISEVARSSANINNGGQSRWANFFHGVFLLIFVLALTPIIKMIPMASLAAMLIYVGFRLANPKEFAHMWHIGREQLAIFMVTIIVTLATDLLIGIGAGIALKLAIELINGVPLKNLFRADTEMKYENGQYLLKINGAGVFSNYLGIKKTLEKLPKEAQVVIDANNTYYVDHTVMENLHHLQREFQQSGGKMIMEALVNHKPVSDHPFAALKKSK